MIFTRVGLEKPCIMDVKVGAKTYGPDASPQKIQKQDASYAGSATCSVSAQYYLSSIPLFRSQRHLFYFRSVFSVFYSAHRAACSISAYLTAISLFQFSGVAIQFMLILSLYFRLLVAPSVLFQLIWQHFSIFAPACLQR
jgi:hypothetical protein